MYVAINTSCATTAAVGIFWTDFEGPTIYLLLFNSSTPKRSENAGLNEYESLSAAAAAAVQHELLHKLIDDELPLYIHTNIYTIPGKRRNGDASVMGVVDRWSADGLRYIVFIQLMYCCIYTSYIQAGREQKGGIKCIDK